MKLEQICKTCEFNFSGVCAGHGGLYAYGEKISNFSKECECWNADVSYYTKLIKEASWYIREPYNNCKIDYDTFISLIDRDYKGEPIEVNIYSAIENIYGLNVIKLATVLDVSVGVITYAKNRGTTKKRIKDFSEILKIPQEYFERCTNKDFEKLRECKLKFDNSKIEIKLESKKSIKKAIRLIAFCLECNIERAAEFAGISKIEWSANSNLDEFNQSERKMINYILNKKKIEGIRLSEFTYFFDGNSNPRLDISYMKS
ncbi:hypothetical protein FDB40_17200 [Clostridium botulinum]|nr:hypothetical protein [Clostridium botulinum]